MSALAPLLLAAALLLLLAAVVAAALAWRGESSLLALGDLPTLSVAEVLARHRRAAFGQPVEVLGTIECDLPLKAPYSETTCIAFEYSTAEESEVLVGRPGSRHAHTVEYGGHDSQAQHVRRFFVHDASGRIAVDPEGASIDMIETVARYEEYTGIGGAGREIWREERALPVGNRVFVLGYLGDDHGAPLICRHPANPRRRFMISHRDEGALSARVRLRAYGLYLAAVLCAAAAAAALVAAARLG